ncbi:glutamate synthase-related protein [Tuwongella immobilis]|uniref:Glutamine amidotransferase type-2 domain-containing protein n=1 Tax=Tuwongella immobilis TaxID=692036 RepID=A0A6C2YU16_9BACT|nr:glutamate synthase-related protein [Tuwongella immobilis]VIP04924.1 glutamate synthase : Glutamate synthase OS=Clostridium acetobutylicum GN=NL50_00220 PE=4 SV=1: GATase_2: Glu_syn_central: Glu_synthase: GXGXG [Tuwongella immobilis]VTS07207.1 glutamate synthase : Glutamate synthase OS=Clostridium acetobutylicum GN=NL50_00220 PE=4 SV=1: GATase_2: Glu_syn_central: Glu_synthase: GXGXG [Tuwongella immobilis]
MQGYGLELVRSKRLLYQDEVGSDACGIGGVAAKDGKPSAEVLKKSLLALASLEHRGGVCGEAGDGAGLTLQIPQAFFREEAKRHKFDQARYLKPEDRIGLGVFFFFDSAPGKIDQAKALIQSLLSGGPIHLFGWRNVPTNPDAIPASSRENQPARIEQLLFRVDGDPVQADVWLYRRRLELRQQLTQAGLDVYACSLSSRLMSYKGLLTSQQFINFYSDLHDPTVETGIAYFHRRYSTNTYPNWRLAQPFRFLCHNGEINTIRTNRNAVQAYARGLEPQLPGQDLLTPKMSDSASLDEWVEHLVMERNWSLFRALRVSLPPVWDSEAEVWGQDAVDLFTYCRRTFGSLCAWDGPAGLVASDGSVLVGVVDRMGLRPVRWCSDQRGWLYIGSESGVFGLDNSTIVASGQLQPGQMIALDTTTGERLDSYQIMARIAAEAKAELGGDIHGLNRQQIVVPEKFDFSSQMDDQVGSMLRDRSWSIEHLLQAHGWDFERAQFVKDMAKLKKEPLSSMGYDRVLTIFSAHHPTLFKYLQQTFAEVTNPPIDPYREGGAMSLSTYLGRSSLSNKSSDELPIRQMELSMPVLSDANLEEIRANELLGLTTLSAVYPQRGGRDALNEALHRLRSEAEKAVHAGYNVIAISDKEAFVEGMVPIPSLLALGAVHTYLCKQGLRERCSLVVQAGDIQEGHDICVLVGFGADAVHPYLMLRLIKNGLTFKDPDTKQDYTLSSHECLENLFAALEDTVKKVISKMGITTIEGYRGAQLFEAVGFGDELMEFLGDFPSRIGGLNLAELVDDANWRLDRALKMSNAVLGRNKDYMAFNAQIRMALRKAATALSAKDSEEAEAGGEQAYANRQEKVVTEGMPAPGDDLTKEYITFSNMVNERVPTVLRDLFLIKRSNVPISPDEVQPAVDMVRDHFRGAAMSHGALTGLSHQTLAAAFNDLDGYSNSGEGGEARFRNDAPERPWGPFWEQTLAERLANPDELTLGGDPRKSRYRSRIRQLASGRFGVDAEYLINADELQIKMAQGAKPGEGGQLMGKKVTKEIAEIRYGKPGNDLISPPPHHDIYSIEDLAQLIYDLKAIKPGIPVSVKLVAVENIGTIAVGVAKAGADIIEIDGIDGGTGAAMVSSKEHAGLPSEMGLAEAHQALVVNGLRKSVVLRVGGGIKTGYDIIKYSLFGADQFSFGQGLMVSVGCIVCKSCHIPNCPTGITGSPEKFYGHPQHTKTYLLSVAEETRQLLRSMGFRHLTEITGRSDLLIKNPGLNGRPSLVDVSRFIQPDMAMDRLEEKFPQSVGAIGVCETPTEKSLNMRIVEAARDAIESKQSADLMFRIRNSDRSVGATVAGLIARMYGREGMPNHRRVKVRFEGEAGQSFGAWCLNSLELELRGFAQDGVAKGISGGTVVVTLDYTISDYGGEIQSVAGNNVGYGATGGTIFIGGRAGHRLGIRNSGATIVAEAAGKYACEYMTRGRTVILGPIENEIGSGMTGGELLVYDPEHEAPAKLHSRSVAIIDCSFVDYEWIHPLIINYHTRTGSRVADAILKNWADVRRSRWFKKIVPLAVARQAENFAAAGTNAG